MSERFKNRIAGLEYHAAADLLEHPENWRQHGDDQRTALRSLLDSVGVVDAVLAYRSETHGGKLVLIDGHLRRELLDQVPVLVLDLSDDEARQILASHDPLAAMASWDNRALQDLYAQVAEALPAEIGDKIEADFLAETRAKAKREPVDLTPTFGVLIEVPDEEAQRELLRTAEDAGFDARAILTGIAEPEKREEPPPKVDRGKSVIRREVKIKRSPRVRQVEGQFDLPGSAKQVQTWELDLKLPEDDWHVGLIVGPSGSGKSTIAAEWFGDALAPEWKWDKSAAVVDGFPKGMAIAEVTGLLSSVGFSSPPGWVKPFQVLSNGEQFRVNLARTLAEMPGLAVVDEFTSVVDRTVAQIGSHAVQKTIRATGRHFIAVTCHYDVIDWLQPDWILDVPKGQVTRRSLRRRPELQLTVRRAHRSLWTAFRQHHYLSHALGHGSYFAAEIDGRLVSFCAVGHTAGNSAYYRTSRLVTLPTYQGAGIGHALHDLVASCYACRGKDYRITSSHPAMIAHLNRSPRWQCTRYGIVEPSLHSSGHGQSGGRCTASFVYAGDEAPEQARALGIV